jgi:hypothetical protein
MEKSQCAKSHPFHPRPRIVVVVVREHLGRQRAHPLDPVERQSLLTPMRAVDDGVAGVDDADALGAPLPLEDHDGGEADELPAGIDEQGLVLPG